MPCRLPPFGLLFPLTVTEQNVAFHLVGRVHGAQRRACCSGGRSVTCQVSVRSPAIKAFAAHLKGHLLSLYSVRRPYPPSWSRAKDSCHPSSTEGLLQVVQPPPAPSQLHAGPAPPLPLGGATSAADTESKARGLAHRALVWPWSCRSVSTGKWGVLASKRLPLLLPFPLSLCPSTLTKGQAHLQVRLAERTPHGWGGSQTPMQLVWCGGGVTSPPRVQPAGGLCRQVSWIWCAGRLTFPGL